MSALTQTALQQLRHRHTHISPQRWSSYVVGSIVAHGLLFLAMRAAWQLQTAGQPTAPTGIEIVELSGAIADLAPSADDPKPQSTTETPTTKETESGPAADPAPAPQPAPVDRAETAVTTLLSDPSLSPPPEQPSAQAPVTGAIAPTPTNENQTNENQTSENQTSGDQVSENQTSENQTSENQANENQANENQANENQIGENQTGDENQTDENQASDNQVNESQTNENQPNESQSGTSSSNNQPGDGLPSPPNVPNPPNTSADNAGDNLHVAGDEIADGGETAQNTQPQPQSFTAGATVNEQKTQKQIYNDTDLPQQYPQLKTSALTDIGNPQVSPCSGEINQVLLGTDQPPILEQILAARVHVDAQGQVLTAKPELSINLSYDSAVSCLGRQLQFTPAIKDGAPVEGFAWVELVIRMPQ